MSIKRSIITASGIVSLAFLISGESVFADTSSFNITSPKGTLAQGEQARIEWLHHDLLNQDIKIQLRGTQGTKGKYPIILPECLANTGSCEWQVPTDIPPGRYRITITSTENKQNYLKGPNFTISASAGVMDNPKQENVSAASCIGGQGHVVKPSTGAKFAQGSTAMLEWQPGTTDETVDLYLDCNQYPIAKGVPNKGYYLWTIPTDSPVGADKKVSVLPGDHSTAGITSSAAFNLQGWKDQEPLQGRMQIYNRDMSGIPKVTAPLEGVRFTKTDPPTLRWTDPDHMLQNRIGIEIYRHHGLKAFYRHNGNNSGVYEVSDVVRKRIERNCGKAPGCYFVVYSRKFPERRITSGHFVTSKAAVAAEASLSVHLQAEGAAPDTPELSEAPMGNKVEIKWTEATDEDQEIRIELLKDAAHYLTIIDRFVSAPGAGNTLTWTVPYDLMPGDGYSVSVVPLEAAEQGAASAPFSVLGDPSEDLSLTKPAADDVLAFGAGRLISQVQWKQKAGSPKLSVKLDLYKDGRRIKTISHETQNPRFKWPVPKTLPSGSDYQIRIEPLRGGDGSEKDTPAFVFSEPFCIRQSAENCDGTPKASAGKVIADTGSVSIVEVSPTPAAPVINDPADIDHDGNVTQEEQDNWDQDVATLADRISWRERAADADGDGVATEEEKVNLARKILAPGGCGDSTIELAGRCVPNDYCPGYDVLNNERSLKPGEEVSARGEERRCGKYLLQGTTDSDSALGRLLQEINIFLKGYGRYQALYQAVANMRKPYTWENQRDFRFESPWHAVSDYDGNCITKPYRQKLERVVSALSDEECAKRADEKKINKSPFASRPVGEACIELRERMREKSEMRLCNHWHLSKKVSDSSFDHCYGIDDERVDCGKHDLFYGMINSVLEGLFGSNNQDWWQLKNSILLAAGSVDTHLEVRPEFRETAGFWWPDQALITDPGVIKDLAVRNPIQAAHAEFIRLMSAYKEALVSRKHRLERPFLKDESVENKAIILDPSRLEEMIGESEVKIGDVINPFWKFSEIESFPPYLISQKTVKPDTLSCGIGTERRNGRCEVCAAGTFSADGAGCQSCQPWEIADSSRSCGSCAPGTSPNKGQTACEIRVCTSKQRWNHFTQRCEDVRHKRKDRWVQMDLFDGSDQAMASWKGQGKQIDSMDEVIREYANRSDRDRDYIYVRGQVGSTGGIPGYLGKNPEQVPTFNVGYEEATISRGKAALDDQKIWSASQEPEQLDARQDGWPSNDKVLREIVRLGVEAAGEENAVFALNINGHGVGDESGNVHIRDLRDVLRSEMKGKAVDLVTFDSCRMGSYELLTMLEGQTDWVIAHTTNTPLAGWAPEKLGLAILEEDKKNKQGKIVTAGKGMNLSERVKAMVEAIEHFGSKTSDYLTAESVVAYRMDRFPTFRAAFDDLLLALTARIYDDSEEASEKLASITNISANWVTTEEVICDSEMNCPTYYKRLPWYKMDAFLAEIKVQFKSDGNIKTLAMTTEKALKALTRKKPDNDHARMMFLWSGSGTSRTHLGEPAFDALSGFLEAYCHGVSSTLVSEDVCHSR